jgi:hypothetical protein
MQGFGEGADMVHHHLLDDVVTNEKLATGDQRLADFGFWHWALGCTWIAATMFQGLGRMATGALRAVESSEGAPIFGIHRTGRHRALRVPTVVWPRDMAYQKDRNIAGSGHAVQISSGLACASDARRGCRAGAG